MQRKKIMILGASSYQVPLIKAGVQEGLYVITVDYLPQNVGHRYGHQFINCSTTDKEGVLQSARAERVDAIATACSDVAVPTVGFVAEKLGLIGPSPAVAETVFHKEEFRQFQWRHGFGCPDFAFGSSFEALRDESMALDPPVVFKPCDSSGSRGVVCVTERSLETYRGAFDTAQAHSRSKTVCVERFLEGTEVGGDGFLQDGELACFAPTHKHLRGFVPVGHSVPTHVSPDDQRRVVDELTSVCRAMGYTNGPLNFDVMVGTKCATIIEMGTRLGGNGIPDLVRRAWGVDLYHATLLYALGRKTSFPGIGPPVRGCGSLILGSACTGTLRSIASQPKLKEAVPEIFEYELNCHPGDVVQAFAHSGNQIGRVLFDCRNGEDYDRLAAKVADALKLTVAPQSVSWPSHMDHRHEFV